MRARTGLIATGTTVVLALGGSAAYAVAAGPVGSGGIINGCYTNAAVNGSHAIVLQDPGTTCPKGTTSVSWNQQGAAGVAGPAGAQGPKGDTGAVGPAGQVGPAGSQGPTGDTGAVGPAGLAGATGASGPPGADGSTVLNGSGAPADTVGNDGDFYIDTAANVLYGPKAGGAWPAAGTSLVGPAGATGPAGQAGPAGAAGVPGASTAGPGGLDVIVVQAVGTGTATAECPADHPFAISGGGGFGPETVLLASYPVGPSGAAASGFDPPEQPVGWRVVASDQDSTGLVAIAECVK